MANTGVEYTVTVTKAGDGASQAVNDFNAVAAAAAKTNSSLAANTTAMAAASATTKTATASFKAMQGTLTIIGLQTFPQLTTAAMTAQSALVGIKTASAAAGVSMTAMGATLAVITVGLYKTVEAMVEFKNMMDAVKDSNASGAALSASEATTGEAFKAFIMKRVSEGKLNLTEQEAETLDRLIAHNNFTRARELVQGRLPAGDFMSEAEKGAEVNRRIGGLRSGFAYDDAVRNTSQRNAGQINTEADRAREIERVQSRSVQFAEEYNKLKEQGIITAEQERNLLRETDTERMNSIAELKNALTDLQHLQGNIAQEFAAGFSQAFVSFLSGTKSAKEAFQQFATQFLQSVAQMIMQMVILNTIKAVAGSSFGLAQGGVRFAAAGLQGVSSVSSPTYFPKFNVVAGEAGREMLTVLARPRMMEVGGMSAVVGSAQGRQLAITSAADLARGGAGGVAEVRVTLSPELRGEIVQESVQGARVTVANDMRQDSPISRGVKGLTA